VNHWLFKSEPESFSISDLRRAPQQATFWDGVRNYQARNFLRDGCRIGDRVLFYHSSTEAPAAVGVCRVTKGAYPDPTQFDQRSPYYDPDSKPSKPRWVVVDVCFEAEFARPVTLAMMRQDPRLNEMGLLRKGNRLSIMPVTAAEFAAVVALGTKPK
jgi:predicted RNA-binding protein with PUA-like domain